MKVFVNDKEVETKEGILLSDFVEEQGFLPNGTAVALGSRVVPKPKWSETVLNENDKITVIQAVCGG
jgi:thiamine biosynthesis protein ThiS